MASSLLLGDLPLKTRDLTLVLFKRIECPAQTALPSQQGGPGMFEPGPQLLHSALPLWTRR
jgi:hypothetical protein